MPSIDQLSRTALTAIKGAFQQLDVKPAVNPALAQPTGHSQVDQFAGPVVGQPVGNSGPNALDQLAATAAQTTLANLSDEQLMKMADDPAQRQVLQGLQASLQKGSADPARAKELNRVGGALFTGGPGLSVKGSDADKKTYLDMTRRAMMQSPSFSKLMNETAADAKRPVTVNLVRGDENISLDSFAGKTVDVADLENLQTGPRPGNEEGITRGEVLAHYIGEQRHAVVNNTPIGPAHRQAIIAENDYRKDLGMKSMRKLPPDDEVHMSNAAGEQAIVVNFDDGHKEALIFGKQGLEPRVAPFFDQTLELILRGFKPE